MSEPKRPNVLFIFDDQHNANCLGCYGNRVIQTPAIDSLAAGGVRATRAYANNPICMPSRISFLTGQYCNTHGIYGNNGPVPESYYSLARHFADHGYQTAAIGKLHIGKWPSDGFQYKRLCDFADVPYHAEDNDYYRYLVERGWEHEYDLGTASSRFPLSTFVSEIPAEHCVENWTGDEAVRYLKTINHDKPFFLWMTFQRPHNPLAPPRPYHYKYDPAEVIVQAVDRAEGKPPGHQRYRRYESLPSDAVRLAVAYYYALITLIDENVAKVLEALDQLGLRDDTIVVFTSDHGDFAGDHGWTDKNMGLYESIHRVPFIVNFPALLPAGRACDDLIESVDLFPTLCAMAGSPIPDSVQGENLLGVLRGGSTVSRAAVFCEDGRPPARPEAPVVNNLRSIRTRRYRLNHYVCCDYGELYDHETDPEERLNQFNNPDYADVRFDLTRQLLEFYMKTGHVTIPGDQSTAFVDGSTADPIFRGVWWERKEGVKGPGEREPFVHIATTNSK